VDLDEDGIDAAGLEQALAPGGVKFMYAVPNFQNPSGVTWAKPSREAAADLAREHDILMIEDNPYGELRFMGEEQPLLASLAPKHTILNGSFSKIVAPGLRVGWLCAEEEIIAKAVTVKQASDLHTSSFAQRVLARYLSEFDIDAHIERIREAYGRQRDAMVEAIGRHFPDSVEVTRPEGGMFLWVRLPEGASATELFPLAIAEKVAFVPGSPFHVDGGGDDAMRLNFSNSSPERIEEGIARLGECLAKYLNEN
jgi:2-aminoadipate transaminase